MPAKGTVALTLQVAASQIGYNGSGTEDNPASKFGAWWGYDGSLGNISAQWCDMFVDWVLDQAGVANRPGPKGSAAVQDTWDRYQKDNLTHSAKANPEPGWLVVFNYGGSRANHIGIVESYNTSTGLITSIQGNTTDSSMGRTGNCCRRKVHGRNYVVGFCLPQYATATSGGGQQDGKTLEGWMADEEAKVQAMVEAAVKDLMPAIIRSELKRAFGNDYANADPTKVVAAGPTSKRAASKTRDIGLGTAATYAHVISANTALKEFLAQQAKGAQ